MIFIHASGHVEIFYDSKNCERKKEKNMIKYEYHYL